ncbi:MAG: YCF48-related protein [Chlorobi bacterium]|nr:YCF48-related protein [Chlorobiota bacterium]MCI0716931.1 YCF48-related protein [Chlorobiota bacterium]
MKTIALITLALFLFVKAVNAQWVQIATIGNNDLRGVKFFNEHTGIVVGQGGIWRSTNSGVNWTQVLPEQNLNALSFYDINNGFVVGDTGKIYRTYDNGLTWPRLGIGITTNNLYGVSFSTMNRCHAAGVGGIIMRTLNGGTTWSTLFWSGQDIYSVIMNYDGVGLTFGSANNEVIISTANGGTNWLTILNSPGNNCYDGTFLNNTANVLVIGNNGRIRKTTNYGLNWSFPQSNVSVNLNAVTFINASEAYIVGNSGVIIKSTDVGVNWTSQTSGTTSNLKDISFINQQIGWTVGNNGTVLRIGIPVSITKTGEVLPNEFRLYQNYPNPFNSETKIKFALPTDDFIDMSLYDITGRKVEDLLSKFLKAGFYEIHLSGNNFSSGIFFCRTNGQSHNGIIKLILIK